MDVPNKGRTLQTTATSIKVIETLREMNGARVTELAEELGLAASTVHAHLSTLVDEEYVVKRGDVYELGLQFLGLAEHVRNRRKAYRIAESYTEKLAAETECRAVFAVEENGRGVYMYTFSGEHAVWTYSTVGMRFYLHQTAAGKAILSRFTDSQLDTVLGEWGLPTATENTVADEAALRAELDDVRERGVAFNHEEQLDGVKAVGVPVNGSDGRVVGAFSVASPANRLADERFETEIPETLLGVANEFELENSLS